MFNQNKIEVIPFKDFMSPPAASIRKKTPLTSSIYTFLPPITFKGLFPFGDIGFTIFLIGSSAIVVFALCETLFAGTGYTEIAAGVSSFLKVVLPLLGYGLIFWLFSTI